MLFISTKSCKMKVSFTKVRTKFSRRLFSSSIEVSQSFLGEQSYIPTNKIWEVWLALGDLATDFRTRGVKPYDHCLLASARPTFRKFELGAKTKMIVY